MKISCLQRGQSKWAIWTLVLILFYEYLALIYEVSANGIEMAKTYLWHHLNAKPWKIIFDSQTQGLKI